MLVDILTRYKYTVIYGIPPNVMLSLFSPGNNVVMEMIGDSIFIANLTRKGEYYELTYVFAGKDIISLVWARINDDMETPMLICNTFEEPDLDIQNIINIFNNSTTIYNDIIFKYTGSGLEPEPLGIPSIGYFFPTQVKSAQK